MLVLTLETVASTVVMPILAVAAVLTVVRLFRGPDLANRVVALELLSTLGVGLIGVLALATRETVYLDVAIVFALLSFLTTVAFTHYMERRR